MNFIYLFFFRIKKFFYILNLIYNLYYLKKYINNKKKICYYSDKIIYNVDNIGIFAIKLIQWCLERFKTVYPEENYDLIYKKFSKYYENCNIHDFEYTKNKYFESFNENFQFVAKPIYQKMPGWKRSTFGITKWSALPTEARNYIKNIEKIINRDIAIISTGPERSQTIDRKKILRNL